MLSDALAKGADTVLTCGAAQSNHCRATAVGAAGTTIGINDGGVTGQTVPHVHVHIVPRRASDGAGSVHSLFRAGPRRPVAEVGAAIRRAAGG